MYSKRRKAAALLVLAVFLFNLTGCSLFESGNTARAGAEKKLELAVKYLAEKNFEQAVLAYNEVIRIDAKSITAYKGLSLAYRLQNKTKEAKAALEKGLKVLPGSVDLTLTMAGFLVDQERPAQAESLYQQLVSDHPEYPVYQAYVRFLVDQNRGNEALTVIHTALGKDPSEYRLYVLAAEVYLILRQPANAESALISSIDREYEQSQAYSVLGVVYQGRLKELNTFADKYIQRGNPTTGTLIKMFGLVNNKKYPEYIAQYDAIPNDLKKMARIRVWLAVAHYRAGNKEKARDILSDLNTDRIKDAAFLAEIAQVYLDMGEKNEARKIALIGIELDSTIVDNYAILGLLGDDTEKRIWKLKWSLKTPFNLKHASGDWQASLFNKPTGLLTGVPVVVPNPPTVAANSPKNPASIKTQPKPVTKTYNLKDLESRLIDGGRMGLRETTPWLVEQGLPIIPYLDTMLGNKSQYEQRNMLNSGDYEEHIEWALAQIGGSEAERVLTKYQLNNGLRALQARKSDPRFVLFLSNAAQSLYGQPDKTSAVLLSMAKEAKVILLDKKRIYYETQTDYGYFFKVKDPISGQTGYIFVPDGWGSANTLPGYL